MENPDRVKTKIEEEVPFQEIESALDSKLGRSPSERKILEIILDYDEKILTDGGKRIRVAIPYIMAEGLNIDLEDSEVIEALIPVEIYHGASLIMDDVIDEDKMRRGMDTPHEKFQEYGFTKKQAESVSILDAAQIQSIAVTAPNQMDFLSAEQKIKMSEIIQDSVSEISHSQILDISAENSLDDNFRENLGYSDESIDYEEFYIEIVEGKTVSLFEAGVKILEVVSRRNLEELTKYMHELGKAFQIRDDILDINGGTEEINLKKGCNSNKIGKDRFSDLIEGSITLPIYHGLKMTKENPSEGFDPGKELETNFEDKNQFLKTVLKNETPEDSQLFVAAEILEESGALEKAQNKAEYHAENAVNQIKKSDLSGKHQTILENIAYYVATRTN